MSKSGVVFKLNGYLLALKCSKIELGAPQHDFEAKKMARGGGSVYLSSGEGVLEVEENGFSSIFSMKIPIFWADFAKSHQNLVKKGINIIEITGFVKIWTKNRVCYVKTGFRVKFRVPISSNSSN